MTHEGGSSKGHSPMASRRAAAWLGLVLAGSLWALHRSRSEAAGAALVDAFGASEERQYNLQQLEEAPRRLKALPQSSHKARSAYAGDLRGGMRGGKAGEGRWRVGCRRRHALTCRRRQVETFATRPPFVARALALEQLLCPLLCLCLSMCSARRLRTPTTVCASIPASSCTVVPPTT